MEDFRWGRCDIKTTALLANVLMKQQAADAGAQEAIIVRDGEVLEGSSTSVFVVSTACSRRRRTVSRILPGTTRDVALELATERMPVEVRRIALDELRAADEVWISAATRDVMPVTRIDGAPGRHGQAGAAVAADERVVQRRCASAWPARRRCEPRPHLISRRLRLHIAPHDRSDTLFKFPCDFPLKVMGRRSDDFRSIVLGIVQKHAGADRARRTSKSARARTATT